MVEAAVPGAVERGSCLPSSGAGGISKRVLRREWEVSIIYRADWLDIHYESFSGSGFSVWHSWSSHLPPPSPWLSYSLHVSYGPWMKTIFTLLQPEVSTLPCATRYFVQTLLECPLHQHVFLLKAYPSFRSLQREEPASVYQYIQHKSAYIPLTFPKGSPNNLKKFKINMKQDKWKKKKLQGNACVQVFEVIS